MNATRLQQIEEIYHATVDSPPEDRTAFVRARCGGDEALLREVESLLSYDEVSGRLIDGSPDAIAAEMFSEDESEPRLIGETIGHYHITGLLGVGGMGEVYLADDTVLNRKVALKLLPPSLVEHGDRLRRFKHEALASSALNHPNIVTIHEFGSENHSNYIVTEFVDGDTLRKRMITGPASAVETLDVAIQAASALAAAHAAGIVHRDIKPENIMIRRDGLVKVLDFGLAKLTARAGNETETAKEAHTFFKTEPGMLMGTVGYMSPEQARGVQVDARTDIWSLGVIMYEMAAGRRPFEGQTQTDVLVAILNKNVPMIEIYVDESLDELARIIDKTLAKNAEERYHSAEELAADLKRFRQRIEFEAEMKRPDTADNETVTRMVPAIGSAQVSLPAKTDASDGRGTSRKARLIAAIGLLGFATVAVLVWQSNILKSNTAQVAAPVSPAATAEPSRFLTYSLTVQSFTDGRYKDPFTLSGEMLFRNKDRIRLNIKAAQTGHLYILNQVPKDDYGEATYNILFPTPMTNDGSAELGTNQEIQIPRQSWFQLDEKEGTELVWLVWSEQPLSEIESAKRFANPEDRGRIKDRELSRKIDSMLQKQQSNKVNVERDDSKKESRIGANTDIVAHIIKLEHH